MLEFYYYHNIICISIYGETFVHSFCTISIEQRALEFIIILLSSCAGCFQKATKNTEKKIRVCMRLWWNESDTHMRRWYTARWWFYCLFYFFYACSFFFQNALWVYIPFTHLNTLNTQFKMRPSVIDDGFKWIHKDISYHWLGVWFWCVVRVHSAMRIARAQQTLGDDHC